MIQLFQVTKSYDASGQALKDITLKIAKGEFLFITGSSGAGKTTLLKLIFCAERATKGQILINQVNIARLRDSSIPVLRRNIGVVFQDFKLLNTRSVFDNVALALEVMWAGNKSIRKKVFETLKMMGLQHKMNQLPIRLSGGEQQRVCIARALVNDPLILLADEPTGNLDPDLTIEIMNIFKDVNARGTTVIIATHDKSLMATYDKRRIMLEKGRLVRGGEMAEKGFGV